MTEEELKELREEIEYYKTMGRYFMSIPIEDFEKLLTATEETMEEK